MDNFHEQLITKRRTGEDIAKIIGILVGTVVLAAACLFVGIGFNAMIVSFLGIGVMVLGIWLLSGVGVEYEYIITNNWLDIDKITGKRNRKRLITLDLSHAVEFCSFPPEKDIECSTTVQASSGWEENARCLVVEHQDFGKVNLIFNPDEITREAIVKELPRALRARLENDGK